MKDGLKSAEVKDDRYKPRYDSLFQSVSFKAIAHSSTGGVCCWCCRVASTDLHHAEYGKGDILGKHLFPVCEWCHNKSNPIGVHSPDNWIRDRIDPILGNRNSQSAIEKLTANYRRLSACSLASKKSRPSWRPPG